MRRFLIGLTVMLSAASLTGCGDGAERESPPAQGAVPQVTVTFQATPDSAMEKYVIECGDEMMFCEEVLQGESLAETPPNTACTMQYGGPEYAKVSGNVAGEASVAFEFIRTNGCEIARWDRLQTLLDTLTPPITLPGGAA